MTTTPDRRQRSVTRGLLAGNLADAVGTQLAQYSLVFVALVSLQVSQTQFGLVNSMGSAAFLLLAVPCGALVDRAGALTSLSLAAIGKVAVGGLLLVSLSRGELDFAGVLAFSVLFGLVSLLAETSQMAAAKLVSKDGAQVGRVVALMTSADRAASIAVPAVVGLALARWWAGNVVMGAMLCLGAAAWSFLSAARRHRQSTPPPAPAPEAAGRPPRPALLEGFRQLARTPHLPAITLLIAAGNAGLAIGDTLEAVLILQTLDLGMGFFGIQGAVAAAAGLLASLVAPRITAHLPVGTLFGWGGLAQALVALLPLGAYLVPTAAPVLLLVFAAAWAAVVTVTNIAGSAHLARATPQEVLGRSSGAYRAATMGVVPVFAFLGGWMSDQWGMVTALSIWPALTLGATAVYWWSRSRAK